MANKKLDALSVNLSKALEQPARKKEDATTRLLSGVDPLPRIIEQPIEQPIVLPSVDQRDQKDQAKSLLTESSLLSQKRAGCSESSLLTKSSLLQESNLLTENSQPEASLWEGVSIVRGHLRIPNTFIDSLCKILDPYEQAVYLQLFRLSWGYSKDSCTISLPALATRSNCSRATTQRTISKLIEKQLIVKVDIQIGYGKEQGAIYRLPIPSSLLTESSLLQESSLLTESTIKDHDHDLKIKDHHQRETTTIYQTLTGNQWTKRDTNDYQQIKNIPINQIESTMRMVLQRAPKKPATLAYFVKEILNPTLPNPMARSARKAQMERIMREVKDAKGKNGYLLSEFSADVKEACAREGLSFDLDLFNEIGS